MPGGVFADALARDRCLAREGAARFGQTPRRREAERWGLSAIAWWRPPSSCRDRALANDMLSVPAAALRHTSASSTRACASPRRAERQRDALGLGEPHGDRDAGSARDIGVTTRGQDQCGAAREGLRHGESALDLAGGERGAASSKMVDCVRSVGRRLDRADPTAWMSAPDRSSSALSHCGARRSPRRDFKSA